MAVILSGVIRFPADTLGEARAALVEMMQGSRGQEACLDCVYSESLEEPGLFRVFQRWTSEEAFMAAHEQPYFARWREARARLGLHGRLYRLHDIAQDRDI